MNRPSPFRFPPFHSPGSDANPTVHRNDPSHDALPPGTRLAEYEILSVTSEGGSGIVYLAKDHGLQREVAIKEYLPAALASRGSGTVVSLRSDRHAQAFALGLGSFIDEARLLARFDHPALMRVYRFWEANGSAYMVMPHYEGVTVGAARAAMARPPDEAWLRALLLPLLGALDVLHGASCYRRDISPENILLLPDGRPVLLDLDAARPIIDDRAPAAAGTLEPAFAPIELYAESASVRQGPWTNLYSLAAVAYHCVSGHAPVAATIRALGDEMEPLSQVVDRLGRSFPDLDYSVGFVSAIERALSVRPQERPQSVAEFRRALLGGRGAADAVVAPPATEEAGPAREAQPRFVSPAGQAPRGSLDEADDAALREALEAALRPEPDDFGASAQGDGFGESPQSGGEAKAGGRRRPWFMSAAALALVVLGAGGWKMWSDDRDASVAPPPVALDHEAEARRAPLPSPGPPAQIPAPVPSGTAAEPQVPPPGTAAPAAPPWPVPEEEAAAADAPGEAPAAVPPPEPPAVAEEAPSQPPPAAADEAAIPPPREVVEKEPDNPRVLCGPRTHFALYRCMTAACERRKYFDHPECRYLRATDEVRAIP